MFNLFWKQFIITKDLKLALIFVVLMFIYWIKNKFFRKLVLSIIKRTPSTIDDEMYPLFSQGMNLIIFGYGISCALLHFGINVQTILATAGASSLALAFALKETLTNIVSGIMLVIDKPFKVGNDIRLSSGENVKVLDIGLRKSKFLYQEDYIKSVLIISNIDLIKNKIYNYTYAENLKLWKNYVEN